MNASLPAEAIAALTQETIYVTQPHLSPLEDFIPYLREIWESKVLTNGGPFHQRLEKLRRLGKASEPGDGDEYAAPRADERIDKHGPGLGDREYPSGRETAIRLLFAFDPWSQAIILVAGNKAGNWDGWYKMAIPRAEVAYRVGWPPRRNGGRTRDRAPRLG